MSTATIGQPAGAAVAAERTPGPKLSVTDRFPPAGSFDRRRRAARGRGCCGFRARPRPWNEASLTVAWCVCLAFAAGRGSPRSANRPKRSSRNSQTARYRARRRRSPPSKDGRRRRSMSTSAAAESGIAWPSGSNPATRRSTGSFTRCEQPGPPLVSFGGRRGTGFPVRMLSRNMRRSPEGIGVLDSEPVTVVDAFCEFMLFSLPERPVRTGEQRGDGCGHRTQSHSPGAEPQCAR